MSDERSVNYKYEFMRDLLDESLTNLDKFESMLFRDGGLTVSEKIDLENAMCIFKSKSGRIHKTLRGDIDGGKESNGNQPK